MMKEPLHREVVIVGSGPAGLTAAIYAARAELRPLVIHGPQPGGQLTITTEVENYPGFADGIQGPELMQQFEEQAKRFGTEFLVTFVNKVDLSKRPFTLWTEEGHEIKAETLIVASGASAKWLGIPGEAPAPEGLGGLGVRASKIMQDKARSNPKIDFIWNAEVKEIVGSPETGVTGIKLEDNKTGEESEFACEGVFIAIGHKPNTDVFKDWLDMDAVGYIKTAGVSMATNIPGVFACGDAQDSVYRQAVTAAGTGCMAAIDAERFLDSLPVETPTGESVTIEGGAASADHEQITLPDGEVASTPPDEQPPADTTQPEVVYARPSTELPS